MTDYCRFTFNAKYGETSDFSDRLVDRSTTYDTLSPAKWAFIQSPGAITGTTVKLDQFTTVTQCTIVNKDTTNYVTVTYRNAAGAAVDMKVKILAGDWVKLTDLTVASNILLTANTATCECELFVVGT